MDGYGWMSHKNMDRLKSMAYIIECYNMWYTNQIKQNIQFNQTTFVCVCVFKTSVLCAMYLSLHAYVACFSHTV